MADQDSEPVPRLPRGKGLKLSGAELVKIAMLAAALVAIIVLQRPCSDSVAKLVTSFDGSGSAAMPKPGTVDRGSDGSAANGTGTGAANGTGTGSGSGYVHLTPDMTPEQVREAIEKARSDASDSN